MTISIWRYAHLALALISSIFLLILAITGVILAVDAIQEKQPPYRISEFENITLAQSLPTLRERYFEILQVSVDHNDFVSIEAMDEDGNTITGYIDPISGEILGEIIPKSPFIQWTTALHRSLFLKETGRTLVGIVSFLLLLITISGFILIIKRQQGLRHFFDKINKDFFSQYFHVVTGRWLLIPVLMIALTGTVIFMVRLDFFKKDNVEINHTPISDENTTKELKNIEFFQNTKLADVSKIEFPFIPDDAAEPFIITLNDRTVSVNQVTGDLINESIFPYTAVLEKLNIDLHTGRTNIIWAIILGLASLNIVFFMYTGFVITFKRTRTKIKNKYKSEQAEIVLLVGSENGTTLFFANQIQKQLLADGQKSYIAEMNQYKVYPQAKHLLIFTSTYGLGDAPTNAKKFEELIKHTAQKQNIQYSVIGFGSKAYPDFCEYAFAVDKLLKDQSWAQKLIDTYTINDRSTDEFIEWVQAWTEKSLIPLATAPAIYSNKVPHLKKLKVIEKTSITEDNSTFILTLQTKEKFQSGDLLAVYPANDNRERFYSIGKRDNKIQLVVKLFPNGLGSSYLNNLKIGQKIDARIMTNPTFHFPKNNNPVAMIANGTGIAPFLGMISCNTGKNKISLYAGFRNHNSLVKRYEEFAVNEKVNNHLDNLHLAFSREQHKQYVMDLIRRDHIYFANLLQNNGTIMICGALQMQKDVEIVLNEITLKHNYKPLEYYKENNQILSDCY